MTATLIPDLIASESALVVAIDAASDAVASVGCGRIDAALARLQREINGAKDRLDGAAEFVTDLTAGLAAAFAALTNRLKLETSANLPAPEPAGKLSERAVEEARKERQEETVIDLPESVVVPDDEPYVSTQEPHAVCPPVHVAPAKEWPEAALPPAPRREPFTPLTKDERDAVKADLTARCTPDVVRTLLEPTAEPEEATVAANAPATPAPATNGRGKKRRGR